MSDENKPTVASKDPEAQKENLTSDTLSEDKSLATAIPTKE